MKIVPLSALRDNYIWALCSAHACAVVDPGEAGPVLAFLAESGLELSAILLTHRHNDHIGGVAELKARHDVPVFGPASSAIPQVTHALHDGMRFTPPGFEQIFEVLTIPGHTEEHIAYYAPPALFCGDTLFGAGCGRLLGGTAAQLHASLTRLAHLPANTQVYCAHEYTLANLRFAQAVEPHNQALAARWARCTEQREHGQATVPSSLQDELETNPFLRTGQSEVRLAAEKAAGSQLLTNEAVFTALRAWKDHF